MRVWIAQNLQVTVDDPTLNLIVPASSVATCTDPVYQRTALYATCDFAGGGASITGVDVTALVSFRSGDTSLVTVGQNTHYAQVAPLT